MSREKKLLLLFFLCLVMAALTGWIVADLTAPLVAP